MDGERIKRLKKELDVAKVIIIVHKRELICSELLIMYSYSYSRESIFIL
jgi:hypothetical protein